MARLVLLIFLILSCLYLLFKNIFQIIIYKTSFVGAIAVGDLVKTTLGPKGMVMNENYLTMFNCYIYLSLIKKNTANTANTAK